MLRFLKEELKMGELFSLRNIVIYLVLINLITFLAMYLDKKKAKKGSFRTKESTLFGLVMLGGGVGGILGMKIFRHKTKKPAFIIGFPAMLILQVLFVLAVKLL
jgi:uncharacterized membrane protein YsdA (DUF1294 family)